MLRQFHGDSHQVQAVHCHPGRTICLRNGSAGRQRGAAIKNADVIQAKESALKHVVVAVVLLVDPPGEVQREFIEDTF